MRTTGNHPHIRPTRGGSKLHFSADEQKHRRLCRLGAENGFTMIVTLGVLLVSSLLMGAAFVAAEGDIHLTQSDAAAKRAYYAAQAGIDDYEYHLTQDGNYLNYCTTPTPENPALNQYYKTGTKVPLKASELKTAEVPSPKGESSGEKYAIQLLPAETSPEKEECNTKNVVESMIEQKLGGAAGTFRLQSTGFAEGKERTIVATFKNLNFVSYVWYTVYETGDSSLYGTGGPECGHFYGERPLCKKFDNYFISKEFVNGPMHTEDHAGICGEPVFGRNENDRIEFGNGFKKSESEKGYSGEAACSEAESKPNFKGKHIPPSKTLSIKPPPGNEELLHIVEPAYLYEHKREIVLEGSTMSVSKWTEKEKEGKKELVKETTSGVAFPPNGVIYVSGVCGVLYSPFGPLPSYTADTACGNVYIHGNYTKSLTIAAQNDIVINGNITTPVSGEKPSTNALLGLIANNFVRVYHPLTGSRGKTYTSCGTSANDEVNDLKNPTIYAAILALKHSFIVDNFDCGKPNLENLGVYGALAGLFTNGMTGVFSGTTALTGYPYNLKYDNRLQVAEPPHFLNPIQAAWYVQRETLAPNP
jgi:Tfp pilus assembly protein PilX